MRKYYLFSLSLFILAIASCTSYKDVNYFQGPEREKNISQAISNYTPLTIQPGDVLGVTVHSLNIDADAQFNGIGSGSGSSSIGSSGTSAGAQSNAPSYVVDQKGEIHLPLQLAAVKVSGLTIMDVQTVIKNAILSHDLLKDPTVNVKLLNFKISILGDVGRPGIYPVNGERITIPEVLSEAGDLTITAKRNITLIREIDGERKVINIDLTSSNIFSSPYYYLKNNDVLYVEAGKAKYAAISPFNRTLPTVISIFSLAVGILGIVIFSKK